METRPARNQGTSLQGLRHPRSPLKIGHREEGPRREIRRNDQTPLNLRCVQPCHAFWFFLQPLHEERWIIDSISWVKKRFSGQRLLDIFLGWKIDTIWERWSELRFFRFFDSISCQVKKEKKFEGETLFPFCLSWVEFQAANFSKHWH